MTDRFDQTTDPTTNYATERMQFARLQQDLQRRKRAARRRALWSPLGRLMPRRRRR